VGANTAKIRRVDRPEEEPILVAIDRLRRCPEELGNDFWPPDRTKRKTKVTSTAPAGGKSGASTQLDGQVAVPAEKGTMSENQQMSVGGIGSGGVGSSEAGDGWVGDQEYGVDRLGWSDSDELNGGRTSLGDDVVRGEDPLTSSDQCAGLEEVDADVQDQDGGNEEGEEMASVPAGTPECMGSTVRAASREGVRARKASTELGSLDGESCGGGDEGGIRGACFKEPRGLPDGVNSPGTLFNTAGRSPDTDQTLTMDHKRKWDGRLRSRPKHRRVLSPWTADTQQGEM